MIDVLLDWKPLMHAVSLVFAFWFALRLLRTVETPEPGAWQPDFGPEEITYGFQGASVRAFSDVQGGLWLRMADIRQLVRIDKDDGWFQKVHVAGFGKPHQVIDEFFVQPQALRKYWANDTRVEVHKLLRWIDRELAPLHEKRVARRPFATGAEGTTPASADHNAARTPRPRSAVQFVVDYWQGRAARPRVVVSALMGVMVLVFVLALIPFPEKITESYRFWAVVAMLQGGLYIAAFFWWAVGAWRFSRTWLSAGGGLLVGAVLGGMGLLGALTMADSLAQPGSQFTLLDYGVMLADSDTKPSLTLSTDGRTLQMSGAMGFGTTAAVQAALNGTRSVSSIELMSPGGRAAEGWGLYDLIEQRGLTTVVSQSCASACTLAFLGGRERQIAPDARLGFHRAGFLWDEDQPSTLSATDRRQRNRMLAKGVSPGFVQKSLQPSIHGIWYPSTQELVASGFATGLRE